MIHLVLTAVCAWALIPYLSQYCDRRLARQTFAIRRSVTSPSLQVFAPLTARRDDAELLESLAMKIRSGLHAQSALMEMAETGELPQQLAEAIRHYQDESLHTVLVHFKTMTQDSDLSLLAMLLLGACRHGSIDPRAVDHAARVVRRTRDQSSRMLVASAQARFTLRSLTLMPILSLLSGFIFSEAFRRSVSHPGVIALVVIGVSCNYVGYFWMNKIISSVKSLSQTTPLQELITSTTVSLYAGEPLLVAIESWGGINPLGSEIAQRLTKGESLSSALVPLEMQCGGPGHSVRQLLIDCYFSGTPTSDVVTRLNEDLEFGITQRTNIGIQKLTTKLSFPIVFCVLPAFLFLALLPIVVATFRSLPSTSIA